MTNNNSSRMEVPQAKEAMDKFKMEVANEIRRTFEERLQR